MKIRISAREAYILGSITAYSLYVIVVCVKIHREEKKKQARIHKEGILDIKAIAYAGEEVNKRLRAGEYDGDIQKLFVDLKFFEYAKSTELREKYKEIP